ncbi:hypothetical protein [Methylomonas sp. DH-1]|uniref:hypothetical protein n=1 Tax=Methylomonas sp. (strain DH-1) TaxID=1727196 RepID=UPI000A5B3917|nr:hypothetical protein [Methylomonas sp. DH-1]
MFLRINSRAIAFGFGSGSTPAEGSADLLYLDTTLPYFGIGRHSISLWRYTECTRSGFWMFKGEEEFCLGWGPSALVYDWH